jgi:hypothetical protein
MNKNIISLTLVVILNVLSAYSQIKIAAHPLKLGKPAYTRQLFHAVNSESNEVFVFAADNDHVNILRLNAGLFITGEYQLSRPERNLFMAGYDFTPGGLPVIYWANTDFEDITAIQYDVTNQKQRALPGVEGTAGDRNLGTFSTANAFYILSFDDKSDNNLILRKYDDGKYSSHTLNFSDAGLKKENGSAGKIATILERYPLEFIDNREWQPLYRVAAPVKLFVDRDRYAILSFDHYDTETLLIQIDLNTFEISSRTYPVAAEKNAHTNSYLASGKLYQIASAKHDLKVQICDRLNGDIITTYSGTGSEPISLASTPLFSQTGTREAKQLKSSKKFLNRLYNTSPGISVYPMSDYNFLTVGGVRSANNAGQVAVGVSLGVGVILSGGSADINFGNVFGEPETLQNIFFEAMLDRDLKTALTDQIPLYIDHLSTFMANNPQITLSDSFPYTDYFLLGYFDSKTDEYVLRKFENGFYEPFIAEDRH